MPVRVIAAHGSTGNVQARWCGGGTPCPPRQRVTASGRLGNRPTHRSPATSPNVQRPASKAHAVGGVLAQPWLAEETASLTNVFNRNVVPRMPVCGRVNATVRWQRYPQRRGTPVGVVGVAVVVNQPVEPNQPVTAGTVCQRTGAQGDSNRRKIGRGANKPLRCTTASQRWWGQRPELVGTVPHARGETSVCPQPGYRWGTGPPSASSNHARSVRVGRWGRSLNMCSPVTRRSNGIRAQRRR